MRLLITSLLVLTIGILIALFAREDPGYVRIAYQGYTNFLED